MRIFVAFVALVSVCLFSCQREIEDFLPEENNEPKIKEIILVDTTLATPLDTLRKEGYVYDNSGRLFYQYIMLDNFAGVLDTAFKTWYFYAGTSLQPYKQEHGEYISGIQTDYNITFFTYGLNGYIKKDSSVSGLAGGPSSYSATEYSKSGSVVYVTIKSYGTNPTGTPVIDNEVYHSQLNSDNFTSQVDTAFDHRNAFANVFDANPNPIFNANPIRYLVFYSDDAIFANPCRNNITNYKFTDTHLPTGSTNTEHFNNVFVYNADGYPILARQTDLTSGIPGYLKYIFKYY